MTLEEIRKEIDQVDSQMKALFLRRRKAAQEVAKVKAQTHDKVLKPDREQAMLDRLGADLSGQERAEYCSFLRKLVALSRKCQYHQLLALEGQQAVDYLPELPPIRKVCYQGLPASYSEASTMDLYPEVPREPMATFEEMCRRVAAGEFDAGVLPLENSTAGTVNEVYDLLIQYGLHICASNAQKVDHCLAGCPGSTLEDLASVHSHPQALLQCSKFLSQHGLQGVAAANTAVAAKLIAAQKDTSAGVICSVRAAKLYGLTILQEGISNNPQNTTRFVAVTPNIVAEEDHNRVSLCFQCPHKSGSLASVLDIFADWGANLTEIHSRPDGQNPWNYLFYVDFTGNLRHSDTQALLFQLKEELPYLHVLGCCRWDG